MAIEYNFLLSGRSGPKVPHLLVLAQNERTGKFHWSYHTIIGKIKDPKPKASGQDARYAPGAGQFDLYAANGNQYGTLTLNRNKNIRMIAVGDTGIFNSFTGSTDDAQFTGISR